MDYKIPWAKYTFKLDLFSQASCKEKLHLPLLKSAFLGWGGGVVVLKWN